MRFNLSATLAALLPLPAALSAQAPVVDYHQHLFSPAAAALVSGKRDTSGIAARDLIALLDSAGIHRALVLSVAYTWGKASRGAVDNEYEHVKAENDWTARQVAQYPDRLRAFCSFNPLKSYALKELARCSKDPQLRFGLKLHFGNSDVDLDNPDNVAQVRRVFEAANGFHMPIVVHMHTSLDKQRKYGAAEARVFLNEVLSAAPAVPVQIAHLAGSGGYDAFTDSALSVFADAIARNDKRVKNVWFDAAVVVRPAMTPDVLRQIAVRIRQIGVQRVLYGSDAAASPSTYPKAGWAAFRRVPLSEAEFSVIANNATPYMRDFMPRDRTTTAHRRSHEKSNRHRRHLLQGQRRSVAAGLVQAAPGNRCATLGRSCLRLDRR
jgi:predicted TIM-barrel fold metal-dependent hydrolase